MKFLMNETQLWFPDICGKTKNNKTKSKYDTSQTHKHKQKHGMVVKEDEFIKPDFDEVNYILDDTNDEI